MPSSVLNQMRWQKQRVGAWRASPSIDQVEVPWCTDSTAGTAEDSVVGTVETDSEDRAFTFELVAYVTSIALAIIGDTVSGALVQQQNPQLQAIDLVVANARGFSLDTTLLKRLKRARDGGAYPGWHQLDACGSCQKLCFL